ncbi:GFA family protein [Psychrobacter sp. AOP7-A1-24]|uniref:GFA family protein n=1 Tax=Psychrobacter sp. AOP7-A1-24 TaxID=3457646 RepID=UPI00402B5843
MAIKGSCLCRKIIYEVDSLDMPIVHCHCHTCRKAHAAAFATVAGIQRDNFRWLRGEEFISTYESSAGKFRHFCKCCGSHLMAQRPAQSHIVLRVATLDDDPKIKPESHIWMSHDLPWLEYEDMEQYSEGQ